MGRTLKSHDWVFWCGDFNYRIDMDKESLKDAISQGDLASVLENDQLRKEQEAGNVFNDFLEGEISFDPTYKYDLFSDEYDTSEKQRAPAWTDRVLWRRRKALAESDFVSTEWNPGKLVHYGRSELKQSDHRPVIAIIDANVVEIDQKLRRNVFEQVIKDLGPPDSTIVVHLQGTPACDGNLTIYDEKVMSGLIQELSKMGEVTLVRYVEDTMWVTFRDGESALNAVSMKSTNVCGLDLKFQLKSPNWHEYVNKEIELCTTNTIALCANPQEHAALLNLTPEIPQRPKQPRAPARPPLPMSPKNSPRHLPHAGVISILPDSFQPKPKKSPIQSQMQQQVQPSSELPLKIQDSVDQIFIANSSSNKDSNSISLGSSLPSSPSHPNQSKNGIPASTPLKHFKKCSVDSENDNLYNQGNIYEEIKYDDPVPQHPPPTFPPPIDLNAVETPASRIHDLPTNIPAGPPPPLPARRPPPPIPDRSGNVTLLPSRPNNN